MENPHKSSPRLNCSQWRAARREVSGCGLQEAIIHAEPYWSASCRNYSSWRSCLFLMECNS